MPNNMQRSSGKRQHFSKLIKVTEDITTECYLGKDDVTEILDHTEKNVFGLLQQASGREEFVPIDKVV